MSEASSSAPPTGATPLSSPATTSLSSKMEKVDRDGNHMNSSSSSSMQSIPQSSIPPSNNTDKGDDADDESDKLPPGFNPAKIFRKKVKKDYVKIDLTNARDHKASQDMNNRKFEMHADNQRFNTSLLPKPISRSQILSNMFHHKKPSAPFGSLAHHAGVPNELVSTWRQPFRPPEDATTEADKNVPRDGQPKEGFYNSFEFAVYRAEEKLRKWRANPKYKSEKQINELMERLNFDTPKMKIMEEKFQAMKEEMKTVDETGLTERQRDLLKRGEQLWPRPIKQHPLSKLTDRPIKLYEADSDDGPMEELVDFLFMIDALIEAGMTLEDIVPKDVLDVITGKKAAKPFTLNPYDPEFQKEEQAHRKKLEAIRRKEAKDKREAQENLRLAREKEKKMRAEGHRPRRRGPLTSAIEIPRAGKFSDGSDFFPAGYHEAIKKQEEEQRLLNGPPPKEPGEYFLTPEEVPDVDYDVVIPKDTIVNIMRTVLPDYAHIDDSLLNRMQHSCAQFAAMVGSNAGINSHIRLEKIFDGMNLAPNGGLDTYVVSKFTELQRAAVAKEVAEIKKREVAEAKANGTHVEATSNTAGGGKGAGADNSSSNDTKRKFQDKGTASRISLAEFQAKKKLEDEKLRKERAERKKKKYTIVNGPDVVEALETLGFFEYAEVSQAFLQKWRGRTATQVTIQDAKKKRSELYRQRMASKGKLKSTLPPGALVEVSSSEWETASSDENGSDNGISHNGTPAAIRKKKFEDMFQESPERNPQEVYEAMRQMKLKKGRGPRGPYNKKSKGDK